MNTWKVILATLVIFVAGVVTGGLLVNYSDRAQQKPRRLPPREVTSRRPDLKQSSVNPRAATALTKTPGNLPQVLRMDFLKNLDREIRLTDEQHERIEKIITDGQERNRQLWNRVLPEIRREMQETKEGIRSVLKPEQLRRFEELMKQSRPAGQRKADELAQPDRRLRDQRELHRPLPPRDAPLPEGTPQPRPPAEPPANP